MIYLGAQLNYSRFSPTFKLQQIPCRKKVTGIWPLVPTKCQRDVREGMETRRGQWRHQWTTGNRRRRGRKRQVETVIDQRMQTGAGGGGGRPGETGRGSGRCLALQSAVALAVTHRSPGCYIYQAAVWCWRAQKNQAVLSEPGGKSSMWQTRSRNTTKHKQSEWFWMLFYRTSCPALDTPISTQIHCGRAQSDSLTRISLLSKDLEDGCKMFGAVSGRAKAVVLTWRRH